MNKQSIIKKQVITILFCCFYSLYTMKSKVINLEETTAHTQYRSESFGNRSFLLYENVITEETNKIVFSWYSLLNTKQSLYAQKTFDCKTYFMVGMTNHGDEPRIVLGYANKPTKLVLYKLDDEKNSETPLEFDFNFQEGDTFVTYNKAALNKDGSLIAVKLQRKKNIKKLLLINKKDIIIDIEASILGDLILSHNDKVLMAHIGNNTHFYDTNSGKCIHIILNERMKSFHQSSSNLVYNAKHHLFSIDGKKLSSHFTPNGFTTLSVFGAFHILYNTYKQFYMQIDSGKKDDVSGICKSLNVPQVDNYTVHYNEDKNELYFLQSGQNPALNAVYILTLNKDSEEDLNE